MEPTLLILLSLQRGRVGAQALPPRLQTSCLHPLPGPGDSLKENPNILHPSAMLGPAYGDGDEPYRDEKAKAKVPARLSPPLHPCLTLLYNSKEKKNQNLAPLPLEEGRNLRVGPTVLLKLRAGGFDSPCAQQSARARCCAGPGEQPRPLPAAQSCAGKGEKTKQGLQSPATCSLPKVPSPWVHSWSTTKGV